jgi:hypothetical protein
MKFSRWYEKLKKMDRKEFRKIKLELIIDNLRKQIMFCY